MTVFIALHLALLHQFIKVIFGIQLSNTNFYLYNLFIIIFLIFSKHLITLLLGNCYKESKSSGASAFNLVLIKTITSLILLFFFSFLSCFYIDISQSIYIIINFILLNEIVIGMEGPLFMNPTGPDLPNSNPPLDSQGSRSQGSTSQGSASQGSASQEAEFQKPKLPTPVKKIKKNKVPPVDRNNIPLPNYFPAFSPRQRVKELSKLEDQGIEIYEQANRTYKQSPTPENAKNLESSTTVLDYYTNRREYLKNKFHVPSSEEEDGSD